MYEINKIVTFKHSNTPTKHAYIKYDKFYFKKQGHKYKKRWDKTTLIIYIPMP